MSRHEYRIGGRCPVGAAFVIAALAIMLTLAGCGRKGNPQPPPGEPSPYPRTYPSE